MLPKSTVLMKYCLSIKFHIVLYSLFVFGLQWYITSQALFRKQLINDFAARLEYE